MNNTEFSSQFDILYDNITSGTAPGLNEYEKSVLLTKAQDQIIKNYFNPLGNKYKEGHSDSPKRTMDFSTITKSANSIVGTKGVGTVYSNTMIYKRPEDILLPRTFVLRDSSDKELQVLPVSEDEITRLFSKPYKQPYKGQAYKLEDSTDENAYHIIVGKAGIENDYKLFIRYIRVPSPIILVDLKDFEYEMGLDEDTLSIGGSRVLSECELDSSIHNEILDRAVLIAKLAYESGVEGVAQYSTINE